MRFERTVCIAVVVLGAGASTAHAGCPYDHLFVGQDEGVLFLDTSQLYRHWNTNWGTHPSPYGREYYEFAEMWGGGYIRVEPGFGRNANPMYALSGTRGVDYNIVVERVYATPGLLLFDDLMQPILVADGATLTLSSYANHHVHMRYHLPDGLDPTLPYMVSYRLMDTTDTYGDSEVYTFNLGAVPEPDPALLPGDANGDGLVDLDDFVILKSNFGASEGAVWADGDFNGDGAVNLDDFVILKNNFGATAVPEPATIGLLGVGGLALIRRLFGARRGGAPDAGLARVLRMRMLGKQAGMGERCDEAEGVSDKAGARRGDAGAAGADGTAHAAGDVGAGPR